MLTKSILAISLASIMTFPAFAAVNCAVGQTCPLSTHVQVSPTAGNQYRCVVDPQGSKLKLWVHAAKEFKFDATGHLDNVNTGMPYNYYVQGHFANPTNPNQVGEIRFRKIWGHGTVSCVPHSGPWTY